MDFGLFVEFRLFVVFGLFLFGLGLFWLHIGGEPMFIGLVCRQVSFFWSPFAVALKQCMFVQLSDVLACSFLVCLCLCFLFVGAGFNPPVRFDVLVHPRFWRTVVV